MPQTCMMCGILHVIAFTGIRAEVGPVQKQDYTSQPVVVSFMFHQVNDFIVVIHVASKDDSRRHNLPQ